MDAKKKFRLALGLVRHMHGDTYVEEHILPVVLIVNQVITSRLAPYVEDVADEIVCAAMLHDLVEDTEFDLGDIQSVFGCYVALLVEMVTSPEGGSRVERQQRLYPRTKLVPEASIIKVVDRYQNMLGRDMSKSSMYVKEYPMFRDFFFDVTSDLCARLWEEMDQFVAQYNS
jgi:(p)ppGpp synthase/HD superfamily hydrolase